MREPGPWMELEGCGEYVRWIRASFRHCCDGTSVLIHRGVVGAVQGHPAAHGPAHFADAGLAPSVGEKERGLSHDRCAPLAHANLDALLSGGLA